jgi:hypothetical protein
MTEEHRYKELTKADTLNRLTYLVQLHKDRANDESVPSHRRGDPVKITVCTSGDLACVELSMTKAKELIKKTWSQMSSGVERYMKDSDFTSAIPTMELYLTEYGTLWLYARVDRTAGPELQAKWDAIEATRREQFPE